jgi:hypothetical protein
MWRHMATMALRGLIIIAGFFCNYSIIPLTIGENSISFSIFEATKYLIILLYLIIVHCKYSFTPFFLMHQNN